MEIRHADLQIEVEDAEDGGVLLTIIDSARLSLSLPRKTATELLDAIDACMKTGERQTTDSVDVWRTADDLPLFGMHVGIDGASWTCGAVRSWDVDGLADHVGNMLRTKSDISAQRSEGCAVLARPTDPAAALLSGVRCAGG